jgi:hypothetical protein
MNKFTKSNIFSAAFMILALFIATFAQTNGLPKFRKGDTYKSVRIKMIKAGWKPAPTSEGGKCWDGDERCKGRPEVEFCAGAGALATCYFRWKRKGKIYEIETYGEGSNNRVTHSNNF